MDFERDVRPGVGMAAARAPLHARPLHPWFFLLSGARGGSGLFGPVRVPKEDERLRLEQAFRRYGFLDKRLPFPEHVVLLKRAGR